MLDPAFSEHRRFELLGSDTHFAAVHGTAPAGRAIDSVNWDSDPKNSSDHRVAFLFLKFLWRRKKSASPAGARPGLREDQQKHKLAPASTGSARTVLEGVISFYDVAKAVVDGQNFENKMLKAYIRDWPGEEDETPETKL